MNILTNEKVCDKTYIEIFDGLVGEVVRPPLQKLPFFLVVLQKVIDVGLGGLASILVIAHFFRDLICDF